jgi:hypothetical protein
VECTRPIDPELGRTEGSAEAPPRLTVTEQVIYGTNIALAAQWNLPQSAIQFNMTQTWNLFRYAMKLGEKLALSRLPDKPTAVQNGSAGQARSQAFDTTQNGVRTLRSAERYFRRDYKSMLVIHAACSNIACQHVFYQHRREKDFKTGSLCSVCQEEPDGDRNVGLVPFPRMPLATALERCFEKPGVEELCEQAESRRRRDTLFDREKYEDLHIYRDAYSGSAWQETTIAGDPVNEDEVLILRLDFGIDWYQPSRSNGARLQSLGPIIGHVTNLPQPLRGSQPLALLLGITPGMCKVGVWRNVLILTSLSTLKAPTKSKGNTCINTFSLWQ